MSQVRKMNRIPLYLSWRRLYEQFNCKNRKNQIKSEHEIFHNSSSSTNEQNKPKLSSIVNLTCYKHIIMVNLQIKYNKTIFFSLKG